MLTLHQYFYSSRLKAFLQPYKINNLFSQNLLKKHPTHPIPQNAIKQQHHYIHSASTEVDIGGTKLKFITGEFARLADGAAMVILNDSSILATAVTDSGNIDLGNDFLPLTVDYRERSSAGGFIPKTRNRRDSSSSDREILNSRAIDRVLRPLFPPGFVQETQILATLQACDRKYDMAALAINAASCALTVGAVPWNGPIGAVRVAMVDGSLVANPTLEQLAESPLDLLYAGNKERSLMIEAGAKFLPESLITDALKFAHYHIKPIIDAQQTLVKLAHPETSEVPKKNFIPVEASKAAMEVATQVGYERAVAMFRNGSLTKQTRAVEEAAILRDICDAIEKHLPEEVQIGQLAGDKILQKAVRDVILNFGTRCDGRGLEDVRPITCEVDVLPSVHGSSLFQRGETQTLCTVTLGPPSDALEVMNERGIASTHRFFLHYDFPPYSVNEVGKVGGLNRRMVGHGNLAQKGLAPCLPLEEDFPYAVRVTSEVTMSNGSSSMASACGGSLALMDAGVPVASPVAGVSVGLVTDVTDSGEIQRYKLITDIVGLEDHHGDMDFKVTGNEKGVSAIQLDLKLEGGVPLPILCEAIDKAKIGREHILDIMAKAIPKPRTSLKKTAPKIEVVHYAPERKGDIIGPGGELLRELQETYDCTLEFTDGKEVSSVAIFSSDSVKAKEAKHLIQELVADITVGEIYQVVVREIRDFGLIVDVLRNQKGLIHISEIIHGHVKKLDDHVRVGQKLEVECLEVDKVRGLIKLSRKTLIDPDDEDHLTPDPIDECDIIPPIPPPPNAFQRKRGGGTGTAAPTKKGNQKEQKRPPPAQKKNSQ